MKQKKYYPVSRDLVFKRVFNNLKLLKALLKECFKKEVKIIKFIPTEQTIENKNEKNKRLDLVVEIENKTVNIEVNTSYDSDDLARNFAYLCKLHGQNLKISEPNIYQNESIQINLNFGQGKNSDLDYEYIMHDPVHNKNLDVKFKYMEINLDKYYDFWYDKNEEMISKNPLLIAISIRDEDELNKYVDYANNENVKKVRDIVKKLNNDDIFASELSYNERKELEYEQLMAYRYEQGAEEGMAKGRRQGKEEGLAQGKIDVANGLIIDGFSDEKVAKYTKLSIEEIKKLRNNIAK